MPEYVADGDQAVLDVVVHLAGQVAHGQPALGLAQPRGTGAQPLGHGSEQPTQRTDLVRPVALERDIQPIHVHVGGLRRESGQRPADPRRQPRG